MELANYLSFLLAAILLTFAPGPDVMYLLAKSLSSGARHGVTLAAGLSCGCIFHTTLVAVGVAAFIQSSPAALHGLMYAGSAYLLYLAWSALRAKPAPVAIPGVTDSYDKWALYRRGLLMNALNPKVLLFFLAFFPKFIVPESALSPSSQIFLLGCTFAVQAFCCFSFIALCAGRIRDRILGFKNFSLIMNRVEAALLFLIAVGLLFL